MERRAGPRRLTQPSFYSLLLSVCLALMGGMALPRPWSHLVALGYPLLGWLLIVGLGRPGQWPGIGMLSRRLFPWVGGAAIGVWLLWLLTPLEMRRSGIPVVVLWALFSAWSAARLIRRLSLERRVSPSVLRGAVAGYLMLGLTGGLLVSALETIQPGSFSNVQLEEGAAGTSVWHLSFVRLNYYAFVTLTTLGFGDVSPRTPPAQMLSVAIAVSGVFYVAAVMGVLISRLTVQDSREEPPPPL
jgi:voltage-gated potassium channel